jgi:hypothetical protein
MVDPVIVDDKNVLFEEARKKDIARQKGSLETPDAQAVFEDIMSSTTVEEIQQKGYTTIGGVRITPESIAAYNSDPNKKANLFRKFLPEYTVPEAPKEGAVVGFSGPNYEGMRIPDQFAGDENYELFIQNEQQVAKLLMDSGLPARGQQIFVDDYANAYYGRSSSELGREMLDLPTGIVQGIPSLVSMGLAAVEGLTAATNDYFFDNYEETFGESFSRRYGDAMQRYYGGMYGFNLKNLEGTTEGNQYIGNARQRLEAWYKDKYISTYGEDAWRNDHAFPEKVDVVFDEDGEASLQIVTDDKGEIVYDETLDPSVADGLIQSSWNQLNVAEQAGVFFFGGGPFVLLNTARKVNKGLKAYDKVQDARKNNPGRFQDMDDIEVFEYLRDQNSNALFRTWRKAWKKVPFIGSGKLGGYRDELAAGSVMSQHRAAFKFYDEKISEATDRLDTLKSKVGPLSADEAVELKNLPGELDFFRKGRARYANQTGKNPYIRGAFFDEAYISGALAIAPNMIPTETLGMSEGTAEMITAFTAPFFAPYLGRKVKDTAIGVASRVPILGMGVRGVEDLGNHLVSSEKIAAIGLGPLMRGDLDEIQSIARAEGIALNDDDIKALRAFNGMMIRMGTEVFEVAGEQVTMRDQMFNSLIEYGENMKRTRKRLETLKDADGNLVFSAEEVDKNMQSLHLSFAYASGFAPFIRIQQLAAEGQSVTEIFDGGRADSLFRAIRQQDDVLMGMTTQLNLLRTAFAAEGGKLDSNDPINQTIFKLEKGAEAAQDNLTRRRQEMNQLIDLYMKNPDIVDESTIDEIVDMRLMLMPEDVAKNTNRAKLAEETADILIANLVERQRGLAELAGSVPPFKYKEYIQRGADILFDISLGVRKARASARYKKVNDYAADNNIVINMDTVARKLADVSDDVKEVGGIAYAFGGGREFIRRGGRDLEDTFEKMARQGLIAEFGGDASTVIEGLYKQGHIKNRSATEAALFLGEKDKSSEPLAFFQGTVEQVEDVRRVFAYNAYETSQKTGPTTKGAAQYLSEFTASIDELFEETDPNLAGFLDEARAGYRQDVGNVTAGGTYAGKVIKARERKLKGADRPKGQRGYIYRGQATPERGFEELGTLFAKIAKTDDEASLNRLNQRITEVKQDLFLFYGVSTDDLGRPVFDLSNPAERRLANGLSVMLESVTNNSVGNALLPSVRPQELPTTSLPEDIRPRTRTAAERLAGIQEVLPEFSFERANRLLDAEKELAIRVVNPDGTTETRLPFSTQLRDELAPVDDLLATNTQYKQAYNDIRDDTMTVGSDLRNAGRATLEKEQVAINKLERLIGDVRNPEKFFDLHLSNLNEDGYKNLKGVLKSGGMTEEEATLALNEMYLRGALKKSGLKTKTLTGFKGKVVEDITDISVLTEMVKNPAQRKTMEIILGKDHAEHLEDIADWMNAASGNAAGVKAYFDVGQMRMESKIARVFNLARGMVGLDYVIAEVGFRVMMQERQSQIMFILQNKNSARILSKILNTPRSVTRDDLKLLGIELRSHIMLELLKSGGELETLDQLTGDEIPIGPRAIKEKARQDELETLIDIVEGESDEKEDE